ncbi:hypothetical protein FACS1894202_11220 [Clostridia bacterium]|nr:hypothetical protein FACS1894202_11220 [Clostridia bacterium]
MRKIITYVAGKSEKAEICGKGHRKIPESEWTRIPNHHPPIIGYDTFEKVRATKRHHIQPRKLRKAKAVDTERLEIIQPPTFIADISTTRALYEQLVLGEIDADTYRTLSAQ